MPQRFAAQLLTDRPGRTVAQVVGRLLAVQAQDTRGARLAVRARSRGLTAADVDRALTTERSVVVGDLNRGTAHLVLAADYWWLHRLTAPGLRTRTERRLNQLGVTSDQRSRARRVITEELAGGPRTRAQIGAALTAEGIEATGPRTYHLLRLAGVDGVAVRGPVRDGAPAFVDAASWLGPPPDLERGESLALLAERYLAGHGPAGPRDLARWAGIALRDAREGLQAIVSETIGGADAVVLADSTPPPAPVPEPVLLGAFEPVLLGWESRAGVLGDRAPEVVSGGVFRSFILAQGHAAGLWRIERGRVRLEADDGLGEGMRLALEQDAADVESFLGHRDAAGASEA